jgi:4-alpha-glucanotransferase
LVEQAATQGVSTIGLNPLHPLYPGNPAHRSPYSPTSRNFLNTLYIDVTKVPNYDTCKAAKSRVASKDFQAQLKQVNSQKLIDYPHAASLKYQVLEMLFENFQASHIAKNSALNKEFEAFKNEMGEDLLLLATFDALYEHFRQKDFNAFGWTSWPKAYQDHDSAAVKKFQQDYADRVAYFTFLQWIADRQLAEINQQAKANGMALGLYLDLAVGCDGGGADVWSNRSLYVSGGAVGAPPDATNLLGQDWGLTPINPVELRRQGFQPFVRALRSNMRHAGAIRIDHVLGYMRQYWVAPSKKADEGIYITFPFEDLLRIIALESRRDSCVVIGEDLGTTPDGFGEIMAAAGLLSYKILFFERWESGLFQRPELYPEQAMVTVSTHDLPTLAGWWTGNDLTWRNNLNLYPDEAMGVQDRQNRIKDRDHLIAAMIDMQVLNPDDAPAASPAKMNAKLAEAVQSYLAKSPCSIQMIPLEDALAMHEQVNIPGTIDEHPNWLQRLDLDVNAIWQQPSMQDLVKIMQRERPHQ